ncbi:gp53-like domain-containing protein [Photorhabdus sp. SF281]|uniref:gp53-like domain-containing protein n=1 Tax=Photorhabdus sp. SF281 TaxID=3459527 RepID=UPI00404431DD
MSNKNEFKAFSASQDANVISQGEYEESRDLETGMSPNTISIDLLNKVLRQSSTISSVVANFISTQCSDDVLDDGDIDKLTIQLNTALEKKALTEIPSTSLTQKGVIQLTDVLGDSNTLAVTQKLAQEIITLLSENINSRVPNIRQVNGKALSENIYLDAVDIGVYTKEEVDNQVNAKGNRNSASKEINGWWRCGDAGVIYQWGRTGVIDAGHIERIQLPISFYNTHYVVNINAIQSKMGFMGASVGYVNVINNSFFDLLNSWVNAKWDSPFFWIAIGY